MGRSRFMADSNSLGLDFDKATPSEQQPAEETADSEQKPDKKKPYVNLERVKTGGPQRVRSQRLTPIAFD